MATTKDRIQDILEKAAPFGARVLVTENADGSIDGEILTPVPRGVDPSEIIVEIQDNLLDRAEPFPKGSWQDFGIRFPPRSSDDKEKYPLSGGLFNTFSSFNPITQNGIATNASVALTITEGLRKKYYRKPEQVVFRVHWNRYGDRPPKDRT